MKTSAIHQFKKYRQELTKLRSNLQSQIDEIDETLGVATNGHHLGPPKSELPARRRPNQQNKLSLREAISIATKSRPLSKAEIIEAVGKLGYRFSTDDPAGSLNACLYSKQGKKNFTNHGGKFSAK